MQGSQCDASADEAPLTRDAVDIETALNQVRAVASPPDILVCRTQSFCADTICYASVQYQRNSLHITASNTLLTQKML
jgi:hypothetical protein